MFCLAKVQTRAIYRRQPLYRITNCLITTNLTYYSLNIGWNSALFCKIISREWVSESSLNVSRHLLQAVKLILNKCVYIGADISTKPSGSMSSNTKRKITYWITLLPLGCWGTWTNNRLPMQYDAVVPLIKAKDMLFLVIENIFVGSSHYISTLLWRTKFEQS